MCVCITAMGFKNRREGLRPGDLRQVGGEGMGGY